jgi:hypothetical protein
VAGFRPCPTAHTPIRTHGSHTIRMKIGWKISTARNDLASLAVSQFWKRCGNMPTESGTSM